MSGKFWFWPTLILGVAADQATKILSFSCLGKGRPAQVIPYLMDFACSENRGGLFGMFQGSAPVLAVFSVIAMALILWFLYRAPAKGAWLPVAFGMIGAGAAGNLIDRIYNDGGVRDFILLHIGSYQWPTFNIADALICIGCGMIIYSTIAEERAKSKSAASGKAKN